MLIGIPVYTYSVGFGSYLKDGYNALLTTGSNPSEWAESFARISNVEAMNEIGQRGREFAEAHFDINEVGLHFYNTLSTV
jgi:glycosyltransferase involved in cell wall biosynthesis